MPTTQERQGLHLVQDEDLDRAGSIEPVSEYAAPSSPSWMQYAKPLLLETALAAGSGAAVGAVTASKQRRLHGAGYGAMLGAGLQQLSRAALGGATLPRGLRIALGVVGLGLAGGGLYLALRSAPRPARASSSKASRAKAVREVVESRRALGSGKSKSKPKKRRRARVAVED